ncbi:MAG: hypothetical protein ACRC6I_18155 [Paracoccaceae bacterium]
MDGYQTEAQQVDEAKPSIDGEKLREEGQKWIDRINAQMALEKDWRSDALKATIAYSGEKADEGKRYSFNILFSNVETIVPSVYNSTPSPDVRRRFSDPDPASKTVSQALERFISLQLDNGALDGEIESATQDAFLAGRGIVRLRVVGDETRPGVEFEHVSWRDYVEGIAKRFKKVPWQAFKQSLSRDEAEKVTASGYVTAQATASGMDERLSGEPDDDVIVWEVWCKRKREVLFIRERDGFILKREPDPLGLPEFFPTPEPIQPVSIAGRRMPINPFSIYRDLADELELLTKRISKIVNGMKVRGGVIAGEATTDIKELAEAGDNELVEIKGMEIATQAGGLDKMISWWPIEKAAQVVAELSKRREEVKQAIYEITGISDIVRGASRVSETATAQQIKSQWGSLRIKKMQRQVEASVRDLFQMIAHIAATMVDPQTLSQMTAIPLGEPEAALLSQPILMAYRVDVESDSTIRADVSRNQEQMNLFLQGTAQYIQAMGPAVQAGTIPQDAALEIYASFARSFKLGKQVEDILDGLSERVKQDSEAKGPTPQQQEAERQKAEKEKASVKMEIDNHAKTADLSTREAQLKLAEDRAAFEIEKAAFKTDKAEFDIAKREASLDIGSREFGMTQKLGAERETLAFDQSQVDQVRAEVTPVVSAIQGFVVAMQEAAERQEQQTVAMVAALTAPKRAVRHPDGSFTSETVVN